jgi:hypothetical protein
MAGLAVFTVGFLAGGQAASDAFLIVMRGLQGLAQHGSGTAAALTGGFQRALWVCGLSGLAAVPSPSPSSAARAAR